MKVWLVTCVVLFVLAQAFQALKGLLLPLPWYLFAGALLALASNLGKLPLERISKIDDK